MFLIGPSGSGKSTCLRCINCLEQPTFGTLRFDGVELYRQENGSVLMLEGSGLRHARAKMPMVFQHFNLFEHFTVLRNLTEGPTTVLKLDAKLAAARARELLERFGLADLENQYPSQLSGGQKQRVGIARAMAMSPRMILLDEPTSSLDPELVSDVLEAIRQLAASGMTMIIVTHEMNFARQIANSVCFFDSGRIIERGPPDQNSRQSHESSLGEIHERDPPMSCGRAIDGKSHDVQSEVDFGQCRSCQIGRRPAD